MERIEELQKKIRMMEEGLAREQRLRLQLQDQNTQLMTEKVELLEELVLQKDVVREMRDKAANLTAQKHALEMQLRDIQSRLSTEIGATSDLLEQKRRTEQQLHGLKQNIQNINENVERVERERIAKEEQIKALENRMTNRRDDIMK